MMKKELNKKEIKKNLPCDLFLSKLFSVKNSMYWLCIYFGRKSNLGHQIICQGRQLHENGK